MTDPFPPDDAGEKEKLAFRELLEMRLEPAVARDVIETIKRVCGELRWTSKKELLA